MEEQLHQKWQGLEIASSISRLTLHYLDGKLEVELCFPESARPVSEDEREELDKLLKQTESLEEVRSVSLYYTEAPL
jgi:hypothetical protein